MMHFAVETTLGYTEAFYGLLAGGVDIDSFGEADPATGKKPALPPQAVYAECMVGVLWSAWQSGRWPEPGEAQDQLALQWDQFGVSHPPALTSEQLAAIRSRYEELLARWNAIAPGEAMALTFPL